MTCGTTSLIGKSVAIMALLGSFSNAVAEELYQWTDKDGTLTYSTTPPPEELTTEYQKINAKQEPSSLKPAERETTPRKPALKRQVQPVEKPVAKQESRLERLVRLSPEPVTKVEPQTRETILLPVNQDKVRKQRKCRDLNNRIDALEARLRTVSSADELNESILLLTKFQNGFDRHCD